MNSIGLSLTLVFLIISITSASSDEQITEWKGLPDLSQPKNTMMGVKLKEMGIEICPDNLHLCPATAYCCKNDSKWDCCLTKAADSPNHVFLGKGECCHQLGFIYICCTPLAPKCKWWGCWFN